MKLGDWLAKNDMAANAFAEKVGVDPSNVSRWLAGEQRPRWDQIAKIKAVTGGQVTADDFLTDGQESRPPHRAA